MLHRNKKALSEVVGYAILIVIAISLSVMVYAFLRLYVPKEKVECNEEINLIIQDYSCSSSANKLNLTIANKGLFKADAAYLRLGLVGQKTKPQINKNNFLLFGPGNSPGLNPGESFTSSDYDNFDVSSPDTYELELEPVVIINKQLVACQNSIITQPIECK